MTRVRVTPCVSGHGYARVRVRVWDCHTRATPYPFPRCYGYVRGWDAGQVSDHLTLLIYSRLLLNYRTIHDHHHQRPHRLGDGPKRQIYCRLGPRYLLFLFFLTN